MALVTKNFSDIITFTRASTGTFFNSAGVLTSAAINDPRFDYNPATLAARGLLIEEARTNSIRNNTMQGAVAGTPGTLPQVSGSPSWSTTALTSGITQEIIGTGTENGIAYIDFRFSGTATANNFVVSAELANVIAALNGQSWVGSWFVKVISGPLPFTSYTNRIRLNDAGLAGVGQIDTLFTPTSTLTRYTSAGTIAVATTAFVQPQIRFGMTIGQAYDATIRIGLPQLENNNISTGVASATVAAGGTGYAVGDVLQIVGGTGTAARLTVATLSGSAVATVTVSTAGSYSVFPSPQPVSVTAITGTGSSATFNIVPQAQSGFATSVIPTTTMALTRNADQASVNTLSPWYNATEGTLFAEYVYSTTGVANQCAFSLDDLTSANTLTAFSTVASANVVGSNTGGAPQLTGNFGSYTFTAGQTIKRATGYKLDDFGTSVNGGAAATDSTYTVPTISRLTIGAAGYFTSSRINGYLRRITYYPRRLSNAELVSITT